MIRKAASADANAVFAVLFSAREEIPLTISHDCKDKWLDQILTWISYDYSWVAEHEGSIVGVALVGERLVETLDNLTRKLGEPPPDKELRYLVVQARFRGNGLGMGLFETASKPHQCIYAQVLRNNASGMASRLRKWTDQTGWMISAETACNDGKAIELRIEPNA